MRPISFYNPNWSEEKNFEVFGPCANLNWHGHNFELIVTVRGEVNQETGYLMDMKILSDLIKNNVIDHLDHKNLNLDVPFMKGKMASCENLISEIWSILDAKISSKTNGLAELYKLRLHETSKNFVEYKRAE